MKTTSVLLLFFFVFAGQFFAQSRQNAVRLDSNARVSNTIIYNNPRVVPIQKTAAVTYSALDSLFPGLGNIRLQSTPFSSDYRIHSSSPAYNRGTTAFMAFSDSLDLDYAPRLRCEKLDMGAYEFQVIPTEITLQPLSQRVCEGTPLLLRSAAQGSNLSYQWQRNGLDLVGKIDSILPLLGELSDSASYRVIVYGDCCNDTSDWVQVIVDAQPQLLAMNDTTILSGSDVSLSVLTLVGKVHWLEADYTTLVLDTLLRQVEQTVQYIAVATNGVCPIEVTDVVTITVSGFPCYVRAKPDTILCAGDTYRLMVDSATVDYRWWVLSTGLELPKFSVVRPLDTISYVLTGLDALGASCADTLTLWVRHLALTAMDDKSICSGMEVQLTSTPAADDWYTLDGLRLGSGNQVKVFPPMNTSTAYVAKRSDGVCKVVDTVKVFANPPSMRILFSDTTLCEGSTLHLQTNLDTNLVVWKRKSTDEDLGQNPTLQFSKSDVFQAWSYDALCGDIAKEVSVTIQAKPRFSALALAEVCQRASVMLSATPNASYWRLEDGTRVSNPVLADESKNYVGVYHQGVCTVMDTVALSVVPVPDFKARQDTAIREGESVLLWSNIAATYWRLRDVPGALSSLTVSPLTTTYYVAVLETPTCGAFFDTVAVLVMPIDTFAIALKYQVGCLEGEGWAAVHISDDQAWANTTYRYLWNTGEQDSVIRHLSAASYTVTVTNSRGVQVTGGFTLPVAIPLTVAFRTEEPFNEDCNGGSIFANVSGGTPGYRYLWSDGSIGKDLRNISAGIYQLQITDTNACTAQAEIRLRCLYKRVMPTLFITPNGDGKNDYLDIKNIEFYPDNTVTIINSYGDEIIKLKNYNNQDVVWDGRNRKGEKIPDGIYYYIIEADGVDNMAGWLMMKLSKSR